MAACSPGTQHSPQDYANAVALGPPQGSFETIVGQNTAIVKMASNIKYPQGDTENGVRSILMYDGPASGGTCLFQQGHAAQYFFSIVKEPVVKQPCDGKRWARFRIVGSNFAFIAQLKHMKYKGTPVTLLEISDQQKPDSIKLVYLNRLRPRLVRRSSTQARASLRFITRKKEHNVKPKRSYEMRFERLLAGITALIFAGCTAGAGMTTTPAAVLPNAASTSSNLAGGATSDNGLQFDSMPAGDGQDDTSQAPTTTTKDASTSDSVPRFAGGRFLLY